MTSGEKIKMTAVLCLFFAVLTLGGCSSGGTASENTTFYVYEIELDKDDGGFRLYVTGEPEDEFLDGSGKAGAAESSKSSEKSDSSENAKDSENASDGTQGGRAGYGTGEKNAAGQADSGEKTQAGRTLVYGGKTPGAAFDAFFADNPDVYTGTLKNYVWGDSLTGEDRFAAVLYIVDSPSLPLKILVRGERKSEGNL